jgi:hypothetical protein
MYTAQMPHSADIAAGWAAATWAINELGLQR